MYIDFAKELIKQHEGLSLVPYRCTAGKLTIGYGHNLDDKPITEKMADFMLEDDMAEFIIKAQSYDWFKKLDDRRKAVIVDMCYNLGSLTGWNNFQAALSSGDYESAADCMMNSKWAKQVGRRAVTLANIMSKG